MTEEESGIHLRIRVERAVDELRRGRPVVVKEGHIGELIFAVETVDPTELTQRMSQDAGRASLVISGERARALGYVMDGPAHIRLGHLDNGDWDLVERLALAVPPRENGAHLQTITLEPADSRFGAALDLLKRAKLLPAALALPLGKNGVGELSQSVEVPPWCTIAPSEVLSYSSRMASDLKIVARAPVPLGHEEHCEFILFSDGAGRPEHIAVLVGSSSRTEPVLLRLHSACLTGDLFGSLRCDCGGQLRSSLDVMAEAGGGVLLYLPQEGRGIGLTNKLRAYALQDQGFDTVDADALLGFRADERSYDSAAEMLRQLGIERVELMTNSPHKMEALRDCGVRVDARVPIKVSPNRHNADYLRAKASRAGHWLDEVSD